MNCSNDILMDATSSENRRPSIVKIVAGILIIRLVVYLLNRDSGNGKNFSYEARNKGVEDAVGEEGLHISDILEIEDASPTGEPAGECISRNAIGEFTGELTEEQAICITLTTKDECTDPCLWYTRDRETTEKADEDLADIDGEATAIVNVCARQPVGGVCASGFELSEDGCCILPMSDLPSVGDIAFDVGVDIAKGEACSLILALSPAIFKFLAGEGLTPGAAKAMQRAFKVMKVAKSGARIIARLSARLAGKTGAKFGAAGARLGAKLLGKMGVQQA